MFRKKVLVFLLVAGISVTGFFGGRPLNVVASVDTDINITNTDIGNEYGLKDDIQDGVILHCFDWKYKDIMEELPNIAAAGFTSVQTSPAQMPSGSGAWYWLYQPRGFYIGNSTLGNEDDLKALCDEAEKYGIKVIVDVVANHLSGNHSAIQEDLKDSKYWHNTSYNSSNINWSNRYQVTHGDLGMKDINSENAYVQQLVLDYIKELKDLGVDGIRWDAAKHISLPSEGCSFWTTVTSDVGLYNYGEILSSPGGGVNEAKYMKEYTQYMTVTDSDYGTTLRNAFAWGNVPTSYTNWGSRGIENNKLLYWAESHDTWSNGKDYGYSNEMSQNAIDRAYAIAASRTDITALYFSRPSSKIKDSIRIGEKGSTHFTSPEVAAVNHFHNAMGSEKEYFVYNTTSKICGVCRESGAVVVLGSGGNKTVTISNGGATTKPGTYIDEITGNEWVVTSTTMTGKVGESGIAVFYEGASVNISNVTPTIKEVSNVDTGVSITWNSVSGADGYKVYRKTSKSGWKLIKNVVGKTSYTDKKPSNGSTYSYMIKAYNSNSTTKESAKQTIKRLDTPNVTLSNVASGIKLSWKKVVKGGEYKIYRKTSGSGWTLLKTTTQLTYKDKSAKAGTKYTYAVICCSGKYKSNKSNSTYIRLKTPVSKLSKTSKAVKVKWSTVAGASKYYIYRKTVGGSYSLLKKTTALSYSDTTAQKGTTYIYAVRAYNGKVKSALSAEVKIAK